MPSTNSRAHTAGPWHVNAAHAKRSTSRQVLAADGSVIAELPGWHQRETLADVRSKVEELLVAIIAAEQSIAPTAKSEPSNVVQIGSEYQRNLDTVAEIVGAPQFDGAA